MISIKSHLTKILLLLSFLVIPFFVFAYHLPSMGDPEQSILTAGKEEALGEQFMQAVRNNVPLTSDPIVTDYIQSIGNRLIAHSSRPSQRFYFFIVNDSSINAFSGPHGYIGINSGLILRSQTESELASVMAHESAHVLQRHIMRGFTEQKWLTLSSLAGILAGIAVSTQNPAAGMSIITSSSAGEYQEALNFSRDFEREADNVGMQILANSGYNACSMPSFFKTLAKSAQINGDNVPELLRSHPVTEDRLADSENRCEQYPKQPEKDPIEFNLIKVRLAVILSRDAANAVRKYHTLLASASPSKSLVIRYGYALALIQAHQTSKASQQIDQLIQLQPNQLLFQVARAELFHEEGNTQQGIAVLKNLFEHNPHHFWIVMLYARALSDNKQYALAREVLEPYEQTHANDEAYLYLLSQSQGFSKRLPEAYTTRAKLFILYGNKKGALQQLRLALEASPHPFLKRQINQLIEKCKRQN